MFYGVKAVAAAAAGLAGAARRLVAGARRPSTIARAADGLPRLPSKGARTMGPTAREWLGAGLLVLILVALVIVLVAAGASGAKPAAFVQLLA
jgi:hypothetical protein